MATMYSLFLGILFTAVCGNMGLIYSVVGMRTTLNQKQHRDDTFRGRIVEIAKAEIGVKEASGNNDGERVEAYLRYTGLGRGYAWCAAFTSWCYGQAGLKEPRNPWSPALFPNARTYCRGKACRDSKTSVRIKPADIFGIYSHRAKRIDHVGLVQRIEGKYLVTVEGNVENRVLPKRRHLSTIYALADWMTDKQKTRGQ